MPVTTATAEEIAVRARNLGQSLAWLSSGGMSDAIEDWPRLVEMVKAARLEPGGVQALMASLQVGGLAENAELDDMMMSLTKKYKATAEVSASHTLDMLASVTDPGDYFTTGKFRSLSGKVLSRKDGLKYLTSQAWKVNYASDVSALSLLEGIVAADQALTTAAAKAAKANYLNGYGPGDEMAEATSKVVEHFELEKGKQQFVGKIANELSSIISKAHLIAAENYATHLDSTATDELGKPPSPPGSGSHGHGIVGWRRVTEPGACEFCLLASTQRYHTKDLHPLHEHCRCSVAPVVGLKDPGHVLNKDLLQRLKAGQYQKIKNRQPKVDAAYKEAQRVAAAGGDLMGTVDKLALKSMHVQMMDFVAGNPDLNEMAAKKITATVNKYTGSGIKAVASERVGWHANRIEELIEANKKKLPTPDELGPNLVDVKKHGAAVRKRLRESGATPTPAVTSALTREERMLPKKLTFKEEMERLRGAIRSEFHSYDLHHDVAKRLFPRVGNVRTPTPTEVKALRDYQDTSFYADSKLFLRLGGNKADAASYALLRSRGVNPTPAFQRKIRTLDKACRTDTLKEATTLFRGMKGDGADGEAYDFHKAWDAGERTVTHDGFLSTSFNPGVAKSFAHRNVVAIRAKAGTPGSRPNPHTGSFEGEQEYLLGRKGKFTIIEREEMHDDQGNRWYVWHCDYEPGNELFEVEK